MFKNFLNKNKKLIKCSNEVLEAIENGIPIVGLESSIISHGMPYPQSLEMAKVVEKLIREEGAQPATLALLEGKIQIGLDNETLDAFAKTKNVEKVSNSNFESTLFHKKPGGTTVSASLKICRMASISVFVTGGIGGVHRDIFETFDISADLHSIKHSGLITICAGPKTILDIQKTYEFLETLSVPVFSFRQNNLPAFWYRDIDLVSTDKINSPEEIAKIFSLRQHLDSQSGLLVCNPIPKKYSLDKVIIEPMIESGIQEIKKANIAGKKLTPALLEYLVKKTNGQTLRSNIELVKNNAVLGAKVAKAINLV